MKTVPLVAGLLAAAGVSDSAHALVWNFSFSAPGETASGTLVTGNLVGGAYAVTGIAGTFNGVTITGLLPTGTLLYGNDNLLYDPPAYLDVFGVAFSLQGGGEELIYAAEGGGIFFSYDGNGASGDGTFSANLVQIPEPASAGLLGTALAGLGALFRRRRAVD